MPTPVSSARQCLAPEAAAALDDAVAVARRRQHAQTTSLHVVFALLSSSSAANSNSACPSPLLRDALSRARSSAYSQRLQFKALELCFGVALDRLPSSSISSSSSCSSSADEPPVSNSLMAAIKRSQANQRRHPDTFQFYQQQQQQQLNNSSSTSSSFSGVKVELQQLILAILDDPVVSRVFGEAGFRSTDIKLAVLRPPPPILRFPRAARCPPLFLCNFSAGDDFEAVNLTPRGFSFPFSAGGDENFRRIGEIMARKSSRNPMLVGVGAGYAAQDFAGALQRGNYGGLPPEISNLKFVSLERDVAETTSSSWIKSRLEELGRMAKEEAGVAVGIGDLKGLVDLGDEVVDCLVSEMTRVLEECRGRLWVMGWSATYETYMKFLSRYPTLDKDWDLQLQLITSAARPTAAGLVSRQPSLMESFVPFVGFFPTAYESNFPVMKPYSSSSRCQLCNDDCEQELATILKGCSPSCEDQRQTKLPSWLQSVDMVRMNNPLDASKIKDDDKVLDARVVDLQQKWNDHCQRLHQGFPKPEANKHQVLPPIIGLPFVSDKDRSINASITSPGVTRSLSELSSAFPVTVVLETMTAASHTISLPVVSEPINKDLISKLQVGLSRGEQVQQEGLRSHQSALSDLSTHKDCGSPASVTSITTDLVLGTLREPSFNNELAQLSPSKKANEVREHHFLSAPKACLSSSNASPKIDPNNLKAFYSSFLEKVRRQDAAIRTVSLAIVRCRQYERHRGTSLKGDIWLSFLGPDRFGKKRTATALAELIFGSRENMICIDLGCQDSITGQTFICDQHEIGKFDVNFRGKTLADQIAEEIRRKPSSVVFLENVEKADSLVQESLSQAIRTGKICDSYGRGCGINNAIFVVSASRAVDKTSSPRKVTVSFCEGKILAAQRWKMKMSVESISEATGRRSKFNVLITSSAESENKQVASKRKLDASVCHKDHQQFSDSPKRAHRLAFLDLNLPVEEALAENDADCSSSGNSSGEEEQWVEEFLKSMDENVSFEPFDFDALADHLTKEISKRFCSAVGSDCLMEIDTRAMEQMLAASWLLEDTRELNNWFDSVLVRSFVELRQRYSSKLSARCVVRLVTCEEETFAEEHAPGVILPSRIILD